MQKDIFTSKQSGRQLKNGRGHKTLKFQGAASPASGTITSLRGQDRLEVQLTDGDIRDERELEERYLGDFFVK